MRNRYYKIISFLFCGALCAVLLLLIVTPKQTYSAQEKRYLESFPELTADNILSGGFADQMERYLADHLPGRLQLIGWNASLERFLGLQPTKEIYVNETGKLMESPNTENLRTIGKNMNVINEFADMIGRDVDLMILPSAGYILRDTFSSRYDTYTDDRIISEIYEMAGSNVQPVDAMACLETSDARDRLYYATDHHLTSRGAYTVCRNYLEGKQMTLPDMDLYDISAIPAFHGSTYSRSALWKTPGEKLELWKDGASYEVTIGGESYDRLFFEENVSSGDMYTIFLNGNQPVVEIHNLDNRNGKGLLVIRDSFSNCMGCFFANAYEQVTLVDLRYYKRPISELIENGNYEDILIEYSLGNFLTDQNIVWLE